MRSAARKTPDHGTGAGSGEAVTDEPDAGDPPPESPGERTVAFPQIRDDVPVLRPGAPEPTAHDDVLPENSGPEAGAGSVAVPGTDEAVPGAADDGTVPGQDGPDGAPGDVRDDGRDDAGDDAGDDAENDAGDEADAAGEADGTDPAGAAEEAAAVDAAGAEDPADPVEAEGDSGEADPVDAEDDSGEADPADAEDPEAGADAAVAEDGENAEDGEDAPGEDRMREIPMPEPVSAALTEALNQLRTAVKDLHFGLDVPGAEEARKAQAAVLAQLDDYVIPRIHLSTAPAMIVVAGSTGAGKSTIVNSLAGRRVTATGVRRPTTGTPVLAVHPGDLEWYARGDLLGGLERLDEPPAEAAPGGVVLVPSPSMPAGVALLDTPDIDSVVEEHHEIAHRMLDAADLWVFVTTASRYADAPSWGLLRRAKERRARLVIVLSRVPPRSRDVIMKHFGRMLKEYGLGDVERFVINETTVQEGRLPEIEIAELRMWLTGLSVDDERREEAVRATLNGVLNSFRTRLPALARHLETQVALRADLRSDVDAAYMGALTEIDEATRDGSLLRGEVLARWQDFAGSGDLMRTLHLRRGAKGHHQGPERVRGLKAAIRAGLESLVTSAVERAAEEVVTRWRQRAGAGDRLAATPGLGRPPEDIARRTARTVAAWQEHVTELIRTEGVTKRSVAKLVSFDVESLSLIFMIGLLGYGATDPQAATGAGALPQRLLRGLLGAESLRSISAKARSDLRARIGLLFDEETLRYVDALDSAGIPDEAAATRLYQATYNLEVAR
ncbi:GTPase [Microbispora sp. H10949]|uniref:GTPase n=1 Tax=Microbispora sp. H10949 TaxID=2729111 RepID=UPI002872BA28|nr:GTPase [Microbispora sp. H10949]